MAESNVSKAKIKSIVSEAKRNCKNRVYYERYFNLETLADSGILQDKNKAKLDTVSYDKSRNESIELFGFDENGSNFKLSISIFSLYPDVEKLEKESNMRFASVNFEYISLDDKCKYSYSHEQLIDNYKKDMYNIGSMLLEIVVPFALSRILFNGILKRQSLDDSNVEFVAVKMTISTHPTCDKLDYKCKFDETYLSQVLSTTDSNHDVKKLVKLMLEDRIDQALMFQGRFEFLSEALYKSFIMWGGKIKRFVDPRKEALSRPSSKSEAREDLLIYSLSGQQIHLTRLNNYKTIIYGMVHSCYEYASYFYACKFSRPNEKEGFEQLNSLSDLSLDDKIEIKAFKEKNIEIVIKENIKKGFFKVLVNDFDGFAIINQSNIVEDLKKAQTLLWTLNLHDRKFGFKMANEKLLGGKGNSLFDLNRFILDGSKLSNSQTVRVSVPKGIVVSCIAYRTWLQSEPAIMDAITKLDNVRRSLAAKSIYVCPYSEKYISVSEAHKILADQCKTTSQVLNSCPLPEFLINHLEVTLRSIFGDLDDKPFAVRSSAVGEDSIETSAAGQMKTVLGAKGLHSICAAIVECWSSQFSQEAVMYKSQNGLKLNLPMAVVVQELIGCKVAGVATTCDPLSGNKEKIQILANLGLGEGVVSGKQADTVEVDLKNLKWDENLEEKLSYLKLDGAQKFITKISGSESGLECCLNDTEIVSLANLLLSIRQVTDIKDREVEWGITNTEREQDASKSSTSSSGSDQDYAIGEFQIHLLQSRPLTNLTRLSSREIDHELDYGYGGPHDIVSRANLGEVMPGALCPLFVSYILPVVNSTDDSKPYEMNHTRSPFVFSSFGFYGQLANMVITHNDIIARSHRKDEDKQAHDGFRLMIGFTSASAETKGELEKLFKERANPLVLNPKKSLATILALDFGGINLLNFAAKKQAERELLFEDLTSLEDLIGQVENRKSSEVSFEEPNDELAKHIQCQLDKLYSRLNTRLRSLSQAWACHIRATLLNIALNIICLKILSSQPDSPSIDSSDLLEDFSILMMGKVKSESCDISMLLSSLIEILAKENQIEKLKQLNHKELYDYLKNIKQFEDFIQKNGHRCYKEFDLSSITWAEDPSFIIKSLATRLKFYKGTKKEVKIEGEDARIPKILSKIEKNRAFLVNVLLPRARNAVVRREGTKSYLIKTIDKYRRAFRHLGALLCLSGRLPSADLVYQMTIGELDSLVKRGEENRADFAKILFKARRRKQRISVLNGITFDKPMINFLEMVELVNSVSDGDNACANSSKNKHSFGNSQWQPVGDSEKSVVGMTSCGGCVTGRACVVDTLDDMDQIEPNDILVTYSIDISWSVYFFNLAGIVTEVGGIVSHGAVVAREYGIPTLCNAFNARSKFKTGQMITLDASRGVCYLVENDTDPSQANQPNGSVQELTS